MGNCSMPATAPRDRQDDILHGQREFFVRDLDGYLYRFYEYMGERRVPDKPMLTTGRNAHG